MKKILGLLIALLSFSALAVVKTPLYISLDDFTVNPLAVTAIKLTPIVSPATSGQINIRSNAMTWTSENATVAAAPNIRGSNSLPPDVKPVRPVKSA